MILKLKIKEWLKRYFLAEIIGTATALSAASVTHLFSRNLIFIAYIGSMGEAIGFYSTILFQNIFSVRKKRNYRMPSASFSDLIKIITDIIFEFGPAGIIDGLLLRPFFMYLFPVLLKNFTLGIFLGKIAGDLTFYFLVIVSYELNKKNKERSSHE